VTPPHSEHGCWEWAACGASVTGSQHLRHGKGCDDAYGYALTDDFIAAVVADGAGSVTGTSAWGAYAACQSVLDSVLRSDFLADMRIASEADAEPIMRAIFDAALGRVSRQAELMGASVTQLATTLCVAVATPELTVFGQIGDGIIVSATDGRVETHLMEEKSEYANATWFLQSGGALEQSFRTSAHTGVSAFALSTDGMAYKITNIITGEPYEPFFTGSWHNVLSGMSAADFAALLRGIKDDQTGDDKTMVLAALQWVEDAFYPSARPRRTTIVGSPPPPALSTSAVHPSQHAQPECTPALDSDARSIVDQGILLDGDEPETEPSHVIAGVHRLDAAATGTYAPHELGAGPTRETKRRWRARHRRYQ